MVVRKIVCMRGRKRERWGLERVCVRVRKGKIGK